MCKKILEKLCKLKKKSGTTSETLAEYTIKATLQLPPTISNFKT